MVGEIFIFAFPLVEIESEIQSRSCEEFSEFLNELSFQFGIWIQTEGIPAPINKHRSAYPVLTIYVFSRNLQVSFQLNTRMDNNGKKFIKEYVEARGGKDTLSEDEKKALVELAKKDADK